MEASLYVSKTGLDAQQMRMTVISNNLANVNTVGYKRDRAVFEDLLYQNIRQAGGSTGGDNQSPTGLMIGTGVRIIATEKTHTQGSMIQTKNALDLAIELGKDRLALNIKKYRTFANSNLARHSLMQKRANAKEKYAYYAQRLEEEERFQETLKKEVIDLPNESFLRKAYAKIANVQDEIVKTTRTVRDEWKKLALKDKLKQGKLCTLRKRNAYLNKQISKSRETSTKRKTLVKEREANTANIRKLEENLPMVVSTKRK